MATNYQVDYNDKRFAEVEADEQAALNEIDVTYGNMISDSDEYFQKQIDAAEDYGETQAKNQQAQTDFAIEQIEQNKEQTRKDYIKEQSASYVDWQKQSNAYGANAEKTAAAGLYNSGYSESSQVSRYNTYQNRVAVARDVYYRAILDYDNQITEARLQNNAILAEIAYNTLQTTLELSLQGFQYKNTLIIEKANKKLEVENMYYNRYQDVVQQINTENAMAEEARQYNESLKIQQAQLKLQQEQLEIQKDQSKGVGTSYQSSRNKKQNMNGNSKPKGVKKYSTPIGPATTKNAESASQYIEALIASGASKDKVANEIAIALREGALTKEEAAELRAKFTPRGVQY